MDGLDLCEDFWWTLPTCGGQPILCKSQFSGKFSEGFFFFSIPKKKRHQIANNIHLLKKHANNYTKEFN
jgi:hypothetical protein